MSLYYARKRAFISDCDARVALCSRLGDQLMRVRGAAQEAEAGKAVEFGVVHGYEVLLAV